MKQIKKANFLLVLILLGAITAFAYSYNSYVTTVVADAAYNDNAILHKYNNEIISKLVEEESLQGWSEIVEQYEDIVIVIENSSNKVVTRSIGRTWSALDVKVQTPFEYKGEAYLIKTSVYFLRDYVTDVRVMVKFIFFEFLIGLSALCLLVFVIYLVMLRPYRGLYRAIEEYDKTGKLRRVSLKGYAGNVYNRFVSMTENLERQQKYQQRIIASISHDIKTPLTSILGYSELASKETTNTKTKEKYINRIHNQALVMKEIIEEFDDYLSCNIKDEKKVEKIAISHLVDYLTNYYKADLKEKNIEFKVKTNCPNIIIEVDLSKFKRVFSNIITNSIRHYDKAKKILNININEEKDGKIKFEIADNGSGCKEDLVKIFSPLYTTDKSRKISGLGLSICKEIIESHNGTIKAINNKLGGFSIIFTIDSYKED